MKKITIGLCALFFCGCAATIRQEMVGNNNLQEVSKAIEKGADVNVVYKNGMTPLIIAVGKNSFGMARLLIEKGADVNAVYDGFSPLTIAMNRNNMQMAKLLVENGADVNFRLKDGVTPLMLLAAVKRISNKEAVKWIDFLVANKADLNMKDDKGDTVLHIFLSYNRPEAIKFILDKGVDMKTVSDNNNTPLIIACANRKLMSNPGFLEIIKKMLVAGIDVNYRNSDGNTALMLAVANNNNRVAKFLMDNGADKTLFNYEKWGILEWAAIADNLEAGEMAVKDGADVNRRDDTGFTPLMLAAMRNSLRMAEFLLKNGADVNYEEAGFNAIRVAHHKGHKKMVELLKKYGGKDLSEEFTKKFYGIK